MQPTICLGTCVLPRAEHGADGTPELLGRILRKRPAQLLFDDRLVAGHDFLPIIGIKIRVLKGTLVVLVHIQDVFKHPVIDAKHHIAVHLDEAAIAVIGKSLVTSTLGQALDGHIVETEIEDRVHHPGHGRTRPRAHRYQQGVLCIAKSGANRVTNPAQCRK